MCRAQQVFVTFAEGRNRGHRQAMVIHRYANRQVKARTEGYNCFSQRARKRLSRVKTNNAPQKHKQNELN
jgi:hypothetical protein